MANDDIDDLIDDSTEVQLDPGKGRIFVRVTVDNAPPAGKCIVALTDPENPTPEIIGQADLVDPPTTLFPVGRDTTELDGLWLTCDGAIALGVDPLPDVRIEIVQHGATIATLQYPPEDATDLANFPTFLLVFKLETV